jgi:hypothetical protein
VKRIFDPDFRYRPSFATDVKDTFERIRREQQQAKNRNNDGDIDAGRRVVKLERQSR